MGHRRLARMCVATPRHLPRFFLSRFLRSLPFPTMPSASSSTRKTTDLKMPTKSDGTKDKRYTAPQFVKKDGTRDMRTTRTSERK